MERTPPLIQIQPGHLVRCTEFSMAEEIPA
jgi:hypothetical protein